MNLSVGPVSVSLQGSVGSGESFPETIQWIVKPLIGAQPPCALRRTELAWFNEGGLSGMETPSWLAWISNSSRTATIWGETEQVTLQEALSVVIPAALRREGILDGHGAIVAPDSARPDDGVFVTGLSGSGKSTLAVSCAVGGARLLSDDSVAIGSEGASLRAWSRRSALSLSPDAHRALLPANVGREVEGKVVLDARRTFGNLCADSLRVRAIAFLEGTLEGDGEGLASEASPVASPEAYRRLLMGHPILALDVGARPCFKVVRQLAGLPAYRLRRGRDLLNPQIACAFLTTLLPPAYPIPR